VQNINVGKGVQCALQWDCFKVSPDLWQTATGILYKLRVLQFTVSIYVAGANDKIDYVNIYYIHRNKETRL